MKPERRQKFAPAPDINFLPSREALYIVWIEIASPPIKKTASVARTIMCFTLTAISSAFLALRERLVTERTESFLVRTALFHRVTPASPVFRTAQRALTVAIDAPAADRDFFYIVVAASLALPTPRAREGQVFPSAGTVILT